MGSCCSRDVIAVAPDNIIPDPEEQQVCRVTIEQTAILSRDYTVYMGQNIDRNASWFFLNKSGSHWGGQVCIELENFVRGLVENDKNKGQVLWRADFIDDPTYQQQLRVSNQNLFEMRFNGWRPHQRNWGNDDYYLGRRTWDPRNYVTTLFINWTMQSHANLTSTMRTGFGCPVTLSVYACGTALARYYQREEPIYDRRQHGCDEDGNPRYEEVKVGTRLVWDKDVSEYVDYVQFCVLNSQTQQPIVDANGMPCIFTINGDATDFANNYSSQFFTVQQSGGWFNNEPVVVDTAPQTDPTLAILLAHLCTREFSTSEIKDNFHPMFPRDRKSVV